MANIDKAAEIDLFNNSTYSRPARPSNLEDMALLAIALEVWNTSYYYIRSKRIIQHDHKYETPPEKVINKIVDEFKVPKCIKNKIKILCTQITHEIDSFCYNDIEKMCNCLDEKPLFPYGVVWEPDGCIDKKKTASKVISCSRRSNDYELMFEIISKYCLENCMKDFSLHLLSDQYIERITSNHPWYRTMRDDLDKYWIEYKKANSIHVQSDILNTLPNSPGWDFEWAVYEYFWDFLTETDQLRIVKKLISSRHYRKYQMTLFSKMTTNQLEIIYSQQPVDIILNFFNLRELELATAVWKRVKFIVSNEQFEQLIRAILKKEMETENNNIKWLIDLWNSAPDELITYMINSNNCEIAFAYFNYTERYKPVVNSFEFLIVVLSRTTVQFRMNFFHRRGPYLISYYHTNIFNSIVEHCLDTNEQLEIKEKILLEAIESKRSDIMHRFRNAFYSGHEEFHKLFTFFTWKQNLLVDLKLQLIQSETLLIEDLLDTNKWTKLSNLIDELYLNERRARKQKKKMLFSLLNHFHGNELCYRANGDERFYEIDNLLEQVLTREEIITFKEKICDSFRTGLRQQYNTTIFKIMNIDRFISWCYCGDESKIKQFRGAFPIDTAFHRLLTEILTRYTDYIDDELSLSSLDELLRWAFQTPKRIQEFKMRQINDIMRSKFLAYRWKYAHRGDIVERIIQWFFDYNKTKIRKFKNHYKADKLFQ